MTMAFWKQVAIVVAKEVVDALRDRRTLLRLLGPALLMGPLMLLAISALIASLEERFDKRELLVVGIEQAPSLRNYLERQSYTLRAAPPDYEAALRASTLLEPVLVVPAQFERDLHQADAPVLEVVSDSTNQRASAAVGGLMRLLQGFNQERAGLHLALRGVSAQVLQGVEVQERDLASAQARATRITAMIPMFIIMAVLYGALTAALDSTAGERERGSLEPLLMNPVPHLALVVGKWLAVAWMGLTVALLANLSFVPAQWWLQNETLQAMFRFGTNELLMFMLLQIPLAAAMSALLMALAIRSKTYKEAQAGSGLIITLVGLAPMVSLLNPSGEAPWYLWVPGLAQNTLMMLVLKGEALGWARVWPSILVAVVLTGVCLVYVARSMREAVAR